MNQYADKIIKSISKGLHEVLSTDIPDKDVEFDHPDVNNKMDDNIIKNDFLNYINMINDNSHSISKQKQAFKKAMFLYEHKPDVCIFDLMDIFDNKAKESLFWLRKLIMFCDEHFPTADLNWINTSGLLTLEQLCQGTEYFNGDISKWDVSSVTNMKYAFQNSVFNGDLSRWDVSSVYTMQQMFENSLFNQPLDAWKDKIGKCHNFQSMFQNGMYKHDLSSWDIKWYTSSQAELRVDISGMFKNGTDANRIPMEYMPSLYVSFCLYGTSKDADYAHIMNKSLQNK